ncbi:MAG: hypothetical protein KKB50_21465 [Planctomycetes bacterium]|nr:hypothetical protein [Planctomycetota bacterium]
MTTRREFLRYTAASAAGLCLVPARLAALVQDAANPRIVADIPVLTLKGKPRERGRIHGEALRDKIHAVFERRKGEFRLPNGTHGADAIAKFVADTAFHEAMKKWTPGLLEETRGIAEGAGLPYDHVYAMQLIDEQWWYAANAHIRAAQAQESDERDKCSVAGVSKTAQGPAILAQNLDLLASSWDATVVLRIQPADSDLEALVVTDAGFIGANGLNNRSIALVVNALLQLDNSPHGLPVSCVVRGVLDCRTLDEAEKFVRGVRHASGQAYGIGDAQRVVCYECSAHKVVPFVKRDGADRFAHTNHPLVNDDRGLIGQRMAAREGQGTSNSEVRYECATQRLARGDGPAKVDTFKALLGSHDDARNPICNHYAPGRGFTAACTIFELGATPRMHIAGNPPCKAPFKVLGF